MVVGLFIKLGDGDHLPRKPRFVTFVQRPLNAAFSATSSNDLESRLFQSLHDHNVFRQEI